MIYPRPGILIYRADPCHLSRDTGLGMAVRCQHPPRWSSVLPAPHFDSRQRSLITGPLLQRASAQVNSAGLLRTSTEVGGVHSAWAVCPPEHGGWSANHIPDRRISSPSLSRYVHPHQHDRAGHCSDRGLRVTIPDRFAWGANHGTSRHLSPTAWSVAPRRCADLLANARCDAERGSVLGQVGRRTLRESGAA